MGSKYGNIPAREMCRLRAAIFIKIMMDMGIGTACVRMGWW